MKIRNFVPAVGFLIAFAVVGTSAQASTATFSVDQITGVDGVDFVPLDGYSPSPLVGTLAGTDGDLNATTGVDGARSPWTTQLVPVVDKDASFQWVDQGTITYDFGALLGGPVSEGSLLWGSPDGHNSLELLEGSERVGFFRPGETFGLPEDRVNTYFVSFAGIKFDTMILRADGRSMESALLTPVPIPAAAILFLSGLLGLFALGWRRNRAQGEPQPLAS